MNVSKRSKVQGGFTIVELLVATLVFSVILVVITSGIVHFTTDYYKAINSSATQTAARNTITLIAQNLQYGGGKGTLIITPDSLCVGSARIDYSLGTQLKGASDYGVFVTTSPGDGTCPNNHSLNPPGNEIIGHNMRLTDLKVTPDLVNPKLYTISAGVAYGDDDLLCTSSPTATTGQCNAVVSSINWATDGGSVTCRSGKGSQFCAVAHLSTQVVSRF